MIDIAKDRRSIEISYDESGNEFTLAKIIEHAQAVWPGITPEETTIRASSWTRYEGDDIEQRMTIEPSEAFWKRTHPE